MSAGQLVLALLSAVLKAGLLLSLAALLSLALKRAPARTRHGVWAVALAGALLLPLLSPWVPDWSVAALPVPELAAERTERLATIGEARPDNGLTTAIDPANPATSRSSAALRALGASGRENGAAEDASRALLARPRLTDRISAAAALLSLWLVGCAANLAWLVLGLCAARRLRRSAAAAGGSWQRELSEARYLVGLRRPVKLLISPEVMTPMTWGVFEPVVLLPARAAGWSAERRRIVLLHELVHVRRADWLVRLLGRIACSIYWPNPLAWTAARRLAIEQEIACDEEVVALGARPSSYAGHLLAIARSMGPAAAVPAHALDMARRSQMEGRLMSILDGNRRLRGGRKLAILALLILAGLVPALAALEPWVEGQESTATAQGDRPATTMPSAEIEGVARVLGELEDLARQIEPFEAELEGLEAEMEPIERELEGLEVEMEPVEVALEGFEEELEPFEAQLEAVEVEMEPYEAQLEAIEVELEPFEQQLESLESELGPFEERLEGLEVEMRPFEERLEEIEAELEPIAREMEQLAEQMEPLGEAGEASAELGRLNELVREMNERMAPLHELMGATHEEMEPLYQRMTAVHREMEPLRARIGAIHEEMAPVFERMAAVHQEMEPLHERMAAIHEEMRPVHERMGAAHERMSPYHERMGEQHERLEPFHRKMGEIHERMRPLHEEMGKRHEELERELAGVVERMLARELAEVTAADTDYGVAARRIVEAVSMRVDDGTLRVRSSGSELRAILDETLGGQRLGSEQAFAAAVERVVLAIGDLEISAGD